MSSPNRPATQPLYPGDVVIIDYQFSNGIGGKRATVEDCHTHNTCQSGWMVKIDLYPNPIDSNWLIKVP